jgi:hypothetical protein
MTPSIATEESGTVPMEALVARLSRQSVDKHFDAYRDVAWSSPELGIDRSDPRFELGEQDALGGTPWYRSQPPDRRARIGLHRVATSMRTGWEFENVLQRGLLGFVYRLPNRRAEFRYLHHEIIEESQHTLMFQEFINRSDLEVRGLPRAEKAVAERFVIPMARRFPALFFLFVLAGEDPIDHVQRQQLRGGVAHPLLERIMRIHVTEEARHLSFARHYLRAEIPRLGRIRRLMLSAAVPLLLGEMARRMLEPSTDLVRAYGIPRDVLRAARRTPAARTLRRDAVAKVRRLCVETGLVNPLSRPLWTACGVWDGSSDGGGRAG